MAEQQPAQSSSTTNTPPSCTPLEQEVLDEYALLLNNLNKVHHPPSSFSPSILAFPSPTLPFESLAFLPAALSPSKKLSARAGFESGEERENFDIRNWNGEGILTLFS